MPHVRRTLDGVGPQRVTVVSSCKHVTDAIMTITCAWVTGCVCVGHPPFSVTCAAGMLPHPSWSTITVPITAAVPSLAFARLIKKQNK